MSAEAQKSPPNINVIHYFDTVLCADTVEWCPLSPYHKILALGTYEVIKKEDCQSPDTETCSSSTKRHGRLYLFEVTAAASLEPLQIVDLPAILDMKWCHVRVSDKVLIAVATAIGQVLMYELQETLCLNQVSSVQLPQETDSEVLALSLDWSTGCLSESQEQIYITVSDSHGHLYVYSVDSKILVNNFRVKAHDYETWIAAFDYWNPTIVYSGGDDCKLRVWDIRTESSTPQKTVSSFDAGVTSLHSNPLHEHIVACGSYDETFRIWDTRRMKHPLNDMKLGGGIWRVKWDPHESQYVIAACMYNGIHLLDCGELLHGKGEIAQICHTTEHSSIAYGADWCYLNAVDVNEIFKCPSKWEDFSKTSLVATCSFYDKQLHISLVNKIKM